MNIYLSSSLNDNLEKVIEYANSLQANIEISRFGDINTLNDNFDDVLEHFSKKLQNFQGDLSLHGFFLDLNPASQDPEIRAITKHRYSQSFKIARTLKVKTVVFHSGYNGLVKHSAYENNFFEGQIVFWQDFIRQFEDEDITATLENTYEGEPDTLIKIIESVNSKNLKMCIDTGHVNINSGLSVVEWIERSGSLLKHVHLHNNFGDADDHKSFLEGTINFEEVLNRLAASNLDLNLVLEIFNYQATLDSYNFLKKVWN